MKKITVLMLLVAMILLLGCQEENLQQSPKTAQQMKKIAEWVNAVNKKFAEIENNQLFLYRHCVDPNVPNSN